MLGNKSVRIWKNNSYLNYLLVNSSSKENKNKINSKLSI